MPKNNKPKVLLVICEGTSDDVTLHRSLKHFIKTHMQTLQIETTNGDIAYKNEINEENCVEYVENKVKDLKRKMFLFPSDFYAVVHIVDTDGAFINDSAIVENKSLSNNKILDNKLFTPNKEFMVNRFTKKQKIYNKLLSESTVGGVKYYKFFFSRNLEHALYDIPDATDEQKEQLSNTFDNTYKENASDFYKCLKSIQFDVPCDYEKSWEYILADNNSLKRCSNFIILLDKIKNKL